MSPNGHNWAHVTGHQFTMIGLNDLYAHSEGETGPVMNE